MWEKQSLGASVVLLLLQREMMKAAVWWKYVRRPATGRECVWGEGGGETGRQML